MALTSQQIAQELQRKRNLGIKPTNSANMGAWNKLTAAPKPSPVSMVKPAAQPIAQPVKQPTPTLGQGDGWVRKTLTDNGFADGDIGWDAGRKMVTVQGKDFLSPTGNIGGWSTASQDAITGALGQFRDRETNNKTQDILSRMETMMGQQQTPQQFNYDPSSDPVYQAALRRAQANAGTASGNAQAEMNRRGILNSTITGDRLGQIQQAEYGRVSDTVLPQLFEQAYARHRDQVGDQYQQGRDKIGDLGNLLGVTSGLNQQNKDNTYRDNTFNRGVKESDRDYAHTTAREAIADKRYQAEFDYNVKKDGLAIALDKARLAHQISNDAAQNAISSMNASTSRMNAGTSASSLSWSKDPKNPDNIYKAWQMDSSNPNNMAKGQTAQDVASFIDSSPSAFTSSGFGSMATKTPNKSQIESMILSSGVSETEMAKLYVRYGIPMK